MFIVEQYDTELQMWEIVAEDIEKASDAMALLEKIMAEGIDCRMEYVKLEKNSDGRNPYTTKSN